MLSFLSLDVQHTIYYMHYFTTKRYVEYKFKHVVASQSASAYRLSQNLDVEHGPSQVLVNTITPRFYRSIKHLLLLFLPVRLCPSL